VNASEATACAMIPYSACIPVSKLNSEVRNRTDQVVAKVERTYRRKEANKELIPFWRERHDGAWRSVSGDSRQRVFLLHLQDKESGTVRLYTPQRDDPTYLSGRFMGCRRRKCMRNTGVAYYFRNLGFRDGKLKYPAKSSGRSG
jgi:hypothetical protein